MRLDFDRTTIIFIIFVLIIAGIFGVNQFVLSQPPIEITIATDPLAEDWLKAAASEFNDSNTLVNGTRRAVVSVQVVDDLDVWRGSIGWSSSNRPDGWLPSYSASLDFIPPTLAFETTHASTARTPLVWGGFDNRVAIITEDSTRSFDWDAVQTVAAAQRWVNLGVANDQSNVNMAINYPTSSMSGIGVMLSATANHAASGSVTTADLNNAEFETWFAPIADSMLNSQRIGGNPAQVMASRGTTVADYGLLPESQWLTQLSGLTDDGGFTFAYPAYQFQLDFPLVRWNDSTTESIKADAVTAFGDFLIGERGQALAMAYGLRPITGEPSDTDALFTAGQPYGILLMPDYGTELRLTNRNLADALIRLVD